MKTLNKRVISIVLVALIIIATFKLYEITKNNKLSERPMTTAVVEALEAPEIVEQANTTPAPTETIVEPVDVVKMNPQGCDTSTQWIWSDGSCHDKPVTKVYTMVSGDWVAQCHAWAAQAGITLPAAAINLISKESKCSPTVCNPNGVACGIPQALPWTKMGCPLSAEGAPCQLKWMQNYVFSRYGSWEGAWSFWLRNRWY